MSEDVIFFRRAAEAIVTTSLNSDNINPTIRELLNRVTVKPNCKDDDKKKDGINNTDTDQDTSDFQNLTPLLENISSISKDNNQHTNNKTDKAYTSKSLIATGNTDNKTTMENAAVLLEFFTKNDQDNNDFNHDSDHYRYQEPRRFKNISDSKFHQPDSFDNLSTSWKKVKSLEGSRKTNIKEFPCHKCHLIFGRSSDLRRHETAHLTILPNICSQCGKGFARKDALKRHFDTLTCRRNRVKLLRTGDGNVSRLIQSAKQNTKE